jgi:hypothetical protein
MTQTLLVVELAAEAPHNSHVISSHAFTKERLREFDEALVLYDRALSVAVDKRAGVLMGKVSDLLRVSSLLDSAPPHLLSTGRRVCCQK